MKFEFAHAFTCLVNSKKIVSDLTDPPVEEIACFSFYLGPQFNGKKFETEKLKEMQKIGV